MKTFSSSIFNYNHWNLSEILKPMFGFNFFRKKRPPIDADDYSTDDYIDDVEESENRNFNFPFQGNIPETEVDFQNPFFNSDQNEDDFSIRGVKNSLDELKGKIDNLENSIPPTEDFQEFRFPAKEKYSDSNAFLQSSDENIVGHNDAFNQRYSNSNQPVNSGHDYSGYTFYWNYYGYCWKLTASKLDDSFELMYKYLPEDASPEMLADFVVERFAGAKYRQVRVWVEKKGFFSSGGEYKKVFRD